MEYSTDDIAAARSLQFTMYIYASMTTFWTYDYVCSLHEELTFLLRSHWTKMKVLYIVTRYLPFIILVTGLYRSFVPNENTGKCRVLDNIELDLGVVLVICSECFFIFRTYVLWEKNRILLAAMLSTLFISLVASFGITSTAAAAAAYATSAVPGITGCYRKSSNYRLFIPFILLFVFELGLLMLTLIRAIHDWRTNQNRLYAVLVNHNVFYYACGLLFSVANIITSLVLQYFCHSVSYDFQFIILAILATRMHLHLWQTNQHSHGSTGAFMYIPMSDTSFLNVAA
ncbi:uncharacterized protein EDB93DRAFT_201277 [Suillus bovinus]|uniref:uncharacterized protein n=1 Tax=Suillus bovinus TaxID=48563 RepID=UPI001B866390|nr:uncharacterized protein EDB93DRAFT_201277 [Suillus bovinus]KAG2127644.1 hypothetical protein EDB93DRAFT_201277 [Suillus bovinus]